MKTYSFNRVEMAKHLTLEQLSELEVIVKRDHKLEGGFYLYDTKGLKKLENIGWAIYHKTKQATL
ncbi:MAG: hypothetical protein J5965_20570 [Aeriscardovia sp.]|nr:hypothetical protein [Aeriscardovia sp.]